MLRQTGPHSETGMISVRRSPLHSRQVDLKGAKRSQPHTHKRLSEDLKTNPKRSKFEQVSSFVGDQVSDIAKDKSKSGVSTGLKAGASAVGIVGSGSVVSGVVDTVAHTGSSFANYRQLSREIKSLDKHQHIVNNWDSEGEKASKAPDVVSDLRELSSSFGVPEGVPDETKSLCSVLSLHDSIVPAGDLDQVLDDINTLFACNPPLALTKGMSSEKRIESFKAITKKLGVSVSSVNPEKEGDEASVKLKFPKKSFAKAMQRSDADFPSNASVRDTVTSYKPLVSAQSSQRDSLKRERAHFRDKSILSVIGTGLSVVPIPGVSSVFKVAAQGKGYLAARSNMKAVSEHSDRAREVIDDAKDSYGGTLTQTSKENLDSLEQDLEALAKTETTHFKADRTQARDKIVGEVVKTAVDVVAPGSSKLAGVVTDGVVAVKDTVSRKLSDSELRSEGMYMEPKEFFARVHDAFHDAAPSEQHVFVTMASEVFGMPEEGMEALLQTPDAVMSGTITLKMTSRADESEA